MIKRNEQLLNKTLKDIEDLLWDDEYYNKGIRVNYDSKTMGSATKIFAHVLLSKMWEQQETKNLSFEQREQSTRNIGKAVHHLVLDSTGIDLHKLYKEKKC